MILFGRRPDTQSLGYVAEYCPACREARAFRVRSVGTAFHLYFLPVFRRHLCHAVECTDCRLRLARDPGDHAEVVRRRPARLEDLVARTHPTLAEEHAEELERSHRLRSGRGTAGERSAAIQETFMLFANLVEDHEANGRSLSPATRRILFSSFALVIVLATVAANLTEEEGKDRLQALAFATFALAGLVVGYRCTLRHWIRSHVVPRLVLVTREWGGDAGPPPGGQDRPRGPPRDAHGAHPGWWMRQPVRAMLVTRLMELQSLGCRPRRSWRRTGLIARIGTSIPGRSAGNPLRQWCDRFLSSGNRGTRSRYDSRFHHWQEEDRCACSPGSVPSRHFSA